MYSVARTTVYLSKGYLENTDIVNMPYMNPEAGDELVVRVTSKHPELGVFVMTPNGHSGLIRPKELAWNNQSKFFDVIKVGELINARVQQVLQDGKINFSRKALLPNPEEIELGTIMDGVVDSVADYGVFVRFDGFIALAPWQELSSRFYSKGDSIKCVFKDRVYDDRNRVKVTLSVLPFHKYFADHHTIGERLFLSYVGKNQNDSYLAAVVSVDGLFLYDINAKKLDDETKADLSSGDLYKGDELEVEFTSFSESKCFINFDMRPIQREREKQKIDQLHSQLSKGDVVVAEVKRVGIRDAHIQIAGTDFLIPIKREELSPNKVLRASDEVFVGEQIKVAYLGDGEDGKMLFSRRFFVKDQYDESLYDLSLKALLETMDIHTNRFVGKAITINGSYFFTELMTVTGEYSNEDGKLLIDPVNGKNLIAILDNRLRNLVIEDSYYEVSIDLANKEYRQGEGTPYMFHVVKTPIIPCDNPYKKAVSRSFKLHTSPETNAGMSSLLEEVGQNLYTSKKRMFFELLQNADDAAPQNGVKVRLQLNGQYFALTHDGYAFNKHDFNSITSAAKSTKSANKKKTGYKGIGFKSVFTNSNSVYIKSGGFNFAFDRDLDIYNNFEEFYFLVNEIENDPQRQAGFLDKFAVSRANFQGVKDIPWQLLPYWSSGPTIDDPDSIFKEKENVAIALHMDEETLAEYDKAIDEVFDEPRFMLFLRNTSRIQLIRGKKCLTIQKNISDNGRYISLVNSFKEDKRSENFKVFSLDSLGVGDEAFSSAGVLIRRKERINKRGDKENYFVRIDANGVELSEVPGIPDRITSATTTSVSLALLLDDEGHIQTIGKDELSLYAYLPMNEHRFRFPFFINADFIPKSDREGVQSDNPWNYFLFYNIGKAIVSMVIENASVEEKEYLNLLPIKELETSSQDTSLLADSFNRGYKKALTSSKFILNDQSLLAGADEIIIDESKLAEAVGHDGYYSIVGTSKRLPHEGIESKTLSNAIFGVERTSVAAVADIIKNNPLRVHSWIASASEDQLKQFFTWLTKDRATTPLITTVPSFRFGESWLSYTKATNTDKCVLTTEKLSPIVGILKKLGFVCSDTILDNHPLCDYLAKQDEKKLFSSISSSPVSSLDFQERLTLFNGVKKFDGVGDESVRKWAIFKNALGLYAPLSKMFAYTESCPEWLKAYMIQKDECHRDLFAHLVSKENIYLSVIEPNIDDILSKTDVLTVYNSFIQSWRQSFTAGLIRNNVPGILSVVERSDDATKSLYVKSLSALSLNSQSTYTPESLEYKIIRLATSDAQSIATIRSIITVDGVKLKSITVKDRLSVLYNGISYSFGLTDIIPGYSAPVSLSSLSSQFSSIEKASEIFAVEEMPPAEAMRLIMQYFNGRPTTRFQIWPQMFCFMMLYRKSTGYAYFGSSIGPHISMANPSMFQNVLDYCFENGLGTLLNDFLKDSYVKYPYDRTAGRYFDCEEYTLLSERAPSVISSWANTPEKKTFIIQLGFHDAESQEILRRKSFKQDKLENIWNITDTSIIRSFLEWVKSSFSLPISASNQVKILEGLFQTIRVSGKYIEQDFHNAREWTNEQYLKWKKSKDYSIYLIEGELPYRGIYNDSYLFKSTTGEYVYFSDTKRLYISSNREPEAVLADVYPKQGNPFTKEDWNSIFLVSTSIVKEKDELIAELQQRIADLSRRRPSENDAEVEDHGDYTEQDNTDERSRYEINRDARIAAKEFLECLSDYDCSEWNPEEGRHLIKGIIKYKGKPITVAVLSSRSRKLYLHPRAFAELMEDPDNLLLNYGYDGRIHSLSFEDIFMDNPNVNLIFDTDVVSPKEIANLANMYMYSKKTCFVVENPKYSQSDVIKSFGLNEKKKDGDVLLGLSDEDIFNFDEE